MRENEAAHSTFTLLRARVGWRRPAEADMEALAQLSGYLLLVLMAALIVAAIEALNDR